MSEEVLERIENKLDALVKLIGARHIEGKNQTESIVILGALGLDRSLIAQIVGVTPKTVSNRLSEAKKGPKSRKKVSKKK